VRSLSSEIALMMPSLYDILWLPSVLLLLLDGGLITAVKKLLLWPFFVMEYVECIRADEDS